MGCVDSKDAASLMKQATKAYDTFNDLREKVEEAKQIAENQIKFGPDPRPDDFAGKLNDPKPGPVTVVPPGVYEYRIVNPGEICLDCPNDNPKMMHNGDWFLGDHDIEYKVLTSLRIPKGSSLQKIEADWVMRIEGPEEETDNGGVCFIQRNCMTDNLLGYGLWRAHP